ncbi:Mob1/phocein [Corynascus novoguineensis]|uniref:Mob1/phocein n=1 Tax=Corynascus novoguineensis TaxID=1126955 RepID=A0AAN7D2W8_9PEZI|nr:Mob1/phocein [Corynascus novoguineensis]
MSLPPSSPRLPSPPPPAEIQIGPKSPLMGPNAARQAAQIEQTAIDTNAKRRIHPGTKAADMAAGPPLVPLHELDSAFQLQEHLAALHYYHTASHTTPINRETAQLLATPPPGIDKTLWLYELCRFLIAQCNTLIVGFLFDTPPCSAATCPEMRAGEWQFLCAVHDTPKSCCAIDYCCHTLDWATNVVTNPKIFPSRFVVDAHDKNTALKNLVNVFRRLHRVFAHAWFQHRGVFWSVESQSGLYVFFKTVCDAYDLLPAENYKLPPEAEGLDSNLGASDLGDRGDRRQQQQQHQPMGPISIAKPPGHRNVEDGDYSAVSRTNTRRHIKSSPSTGSAVTTVPEADEDDSSDLSHRLRGMRISAPQAVPEEDRDSASIPVIVEHSAVAAAEQPIRPSSVVPPPATSTESDTKSEPEPAPESKVTEEGVVDTSEPQHEFAVDPEAPAQTQPTTEPDSLPEHSPEPEREPEPAPEAERAQPLPSPEANHGETSISAPSILSTTDEAEAEKEAASEEEPEQQPSLDHPEPSQAAVADDGDDAAAAKEEKESEMKSSGSGAKAEGVEKEHDDEGEAGKAGKQEEETSAAEEKSADA